MELKRFPRVLDAGILATCVTDRLLRVLVETGGQKGPFDTQQGREPVRNKKVIPVVAPVHHDIYLGTHEL